MDPVLKALYFPRRQTESHKVVLLCYAMPILCSSVGRKFVIKIFVSCILHHVKKASNYGTPNGKSVYTSVFLGEIFFEFLFFVK